MEEVKNNQSKNKKFKKAFIIFLISQIMLVFSTLEFATRFKFIPSWFSAFTVFILIGLVLMAVALYKLKDINQHFRHAFLTAIILFSASLFQDACAKSTEEFYVLISKGLDWSVQILLAVLYVYFFLGARNYFNETSTTKSSKHSKTGLIVFLIIFLLERLSVFLMFFDGIKSNMIANRICTYVQWLSMLAIYIYVVVILILIVVAMKHVEKKDNDNEERA